MKRIGIITGAGPEAGAWLFMQMIRLYQAQGASKDADFPHITLLNIPFAPMLTVTDIENNRSLIAQQLHDAFKQLAHADLIAIACNTLHTMLEHIDYPAHKLIHIVHATAQELKRKHVTKALFLGTHTSASLRLYQHACDIVYPTPDEQMIVDAVIDDVLHNNYSGSHALSNVIKACAQREPFQCVILGCTELPLLHNRHPMTVPTEFFDTLAILAQAVTDQSA